MLGQPRRKLNFLLDAPRISDSVYCVDSETSAGGWAPGLRGYSGLRTQLQVWRWLCLAEHCDAFICNWELFPLNNLFVRALVWDLLTFSKTSRTILSVKYDNTCTKLLSCLLPLQRPGIVLKHYFRSPLSKGRRWKSCFLLFVLVPCHLLPGAFLQISFKLLDQYNQILFAHICSS